MNVSDILASTAEAAFATSESGRILAWNRMAERLLGHPAPRVLGRRCWEVLAGHDVFGNRFCADRCPVRSMAVRREAVGHFELEVHQASGELTRVDISILVMPGDAATELTVVHHLQPVPPLSASPPATGPLTPRELEVLRLLAAGRGTGQMAAALCISPATVRNHLQRVFRKLRVHSRVEAVATARQAHLF